MSGQFDQEPDQPLLIQEVDMVARKKVELYSRYPIPSIVTYNGITVLHYLLGGIGIIVGYNFSRGAYLWASAYLVFAFAQMYVIMPLAVCPNCVYYRLKNSLCISGLNVISKKIAKAGDIKEFPKRGEGLFCHNNLYMAAKIIPIIVMIPALILNFSVLLLALFLSVVGLMLLRVFVVFPKIACVHCRAKKVCPNAIAMGINKGS
jgi:hypothetical protein